MASDKRTVLSTKRARDRRQRAQRRADKKIHDATTSGSSNGVATATMAAPLVPLQQRKPAFVEPILAVHLKLDEPVSSGDDTLHTASSGDESDDAHDNQCESDDDDELVIVCRAAEPDFCTQFVSLDTLPTTSRVAGSKRCRAFSAAIPSFRETSDGFTAYTIVLSTCTEPQQHFTLERRFSEFVALAAALRSHDGSDASGVCRLGCDTSSGDDDGGVDQINDSQSNNSSSSSAVESAVQWELPPKTWFRVTQLAALEERRRQLEQSLARLLAMDAGTMSRRALVRDFLMLDIFGAQVAEAKQLECV